MTYGFGGNISGKDVVKVGVVARAAAFAHEQCE
jgi:hypothetical protein